MREALLAIFFVSGAAALVFENLWFRQAGLAFGNSVWASSLVLASFMAGLAAGAALCSRAEALFPRPLRAYFHLEIVVAVLGFGLVMGLPRFGSLMAPLLAPFADRPALLNASRLGAVFLLMVAPSTAMGMTLPLFARALAHDRTFGQNLGALYGFNTLGAVAGALAVETVLVPQLGIRGAGLVAAFLSLGAAGLALVTARRSDATLAVRSVADEGPRGRGGETRRLLAVAFLAGAVLLALEVVWFRFLAMYTEGTAFSFAVLLAVVLFGIGTGGLAAGSWLRRRPEAPWLGALVATSALVVIAQYAGFARLLSLLQDEGVTKAARTLTAAAWLTLPSSFLSGLLFTLLGAALERRLASHQRAAGLLVLANTTGALAGALLGGFVLLPWLGMERSFFVLALAYAAAVWLLPAMERLPGPGPGRAVAVGLLAVSAASLALFPHGVMNRLYVKAPLVRFGEDAVIRGVLEGLTETAVLLEHRFRGRHHSLRLVTNGFSMTAASWNARRYMGLYADLPLALHERPRAALLICYGIGITARALVDDDELERIDVVDIAPEVIALADAESELGPSPLRDPRVRVHVEDGRAFLAGTGRRYDLITAEPPPPTNAGVVNLYTREHFDLVRSRLAEGGFATYWLPVHTLDDGAAKAVVAAFCGAFPDCTLWYGADLDWMLVGTRGHRQPVSSDRVRRLWDKARGPVLRDVGIESPEQMAALFLADSAGLRDLVAGSPEVVDDRPARIGRVSATLPTAFAYQVLFGLAPARAFASSADIARLWPEDIRQGALREFRGQEIQNRMLISRLSGRAADPAWLHEIYTTSTARLPVLQWFGTDPDLQRIAREAEAAGEGDVWVFGQRALAALADRQPALAAQRARAGLRATEPRSAFLLAYALALEGRPAEALSLLPQVGPRERELLESVVIPPRAPGQGAEEQHPAKPGAPAGRRDAR